LRWLLPARRLSLLAVYLAARLVNPVAQRRGLIQNITGR